MTATNIAEATNGATPAITRKDITLQLASTLADLKTTLGEKKFERRIKKAAKLLIAGVKTKPVKVKKEKKEKAENPTPQKGQ